MISLGNVDEWTNGSNLHYKHLPEEHQNEHDRSPNLLTLTSDQRLLAKSRLQRGLHNDQNDKYWTRGIRKLSRRLTDVTGKRLQRTVEHTCRTGV